MRFKIITISLFLSCILPIIYAECDLQKSCTWNQGEYLNEQCRTLKCYNTSIDNYITDISELFVEQRPSKDLNLQQLTIINSNFSHIENLLNPIRILKRYNVVEEIRGLAVKWSKIKFIKPKAFKEFIYLIELNLSFNSIEGISFISNLPAFLMHLNLTNNVIKNIDFDLFPHRIECLDLSFNKITYITFESNYFPISKCLFLNNNYIYNIQWNEFSHDSALEINLAYNNISTIKFNASENYYYFYLELLDLSHQSSMLNLETLFTTKFEFVSKKLILANNKIQHLIDNITSLSDYYGQLDFSNCSLTNINNLKFDPSNKNSVNFSYNNLNTINRFILAGSTIKTVDLSFNQIDNLYLVFENARIENLNLSSNKISELNSFSLTNLKFTSWLDLSFNNLKLNNNSFSECLELKTLNLSSSNISQIEDLAFKNLISLTYLNLNNNSLRFLNANIFKPLEVIEKISLNNNQLTIIDGYVFVCLPLKSLDINENQIEIIRPKAFYNLSDINIININYNKQNMSIENGAFSDLPLLRQVYLKHSNISNINSDIFSNIPELDILDIRGNNITSINFSNNSGNITYLKELYITFRGTIKTRSFTNLIFLEKLKFLNSEIVSINEKAFHGLFNLDNLEFENTKIQYLDFGALDGLFAASNVDLKSVLKGKHILMSNMFRNLYSIERESINFSNMQIENVMSYAFVGLKRLYKLDLSNNLIYNFQNCTFCGLKKLGELDLSHNKISKILKCNFCGLDSLHMLDLSNNTLVTLKYDDFRGLNSLLELNLNANGINDMELGALQNLASLKVLLLAENNLTEFQVGTFSHLLSLETLDLQKNSISTLLFESFLPLKSLEYLNLEFNNLKSIGHFPMVSNLSLLRRFAVNKNKWKCDYLANMLVTFKKHNINYFSNYLNFLDNNIEGIECIDICKYLLCLKDSHGIN